MSAAPGSAKRVTLSVRDVARRFSFALLAMASLVLMVVGKFDDRVVDGIRIGLVDAFVPILEALSAPASSAAGVFEDINSMVALRDENEALKRENRRLLEWQKAALQLRAENDDLRKLVNFRRDDAEHFITARVVGDTSSAFLHSVLINRGAADGVARGQLAVVGESLVGRVFESGHNAARLLLLTDSASRIPVVLQDQRHRAILGGDNTDHPKLLYLPPEADARAGEWVVTSGYGGQVPPGIPVGVVIIDGGVPRVQPFADLSRLEHVRLVDFGLTVSDLEVAQKPQ
jgi:rod shape-determining protein MreC